MRVLDLGCGRALSSVFLRREFGVQVFVIDGKVGLSSAQPPEMFRAAIEQATAAGAGDTCEVDPATGERKC